MNRNVKVANPQSLLAIQLFENDKNTPLENSFNTFKIDKNRFAEIIMLGKRDIPETLRKNKLSKSRNHSIAYQSELKMVGITKSLSIELLSDNKVKIILKENAIEKSIIIEKYEFEAIQLYIEVNVKSIIEQFAKWNRLEFRGKA